MENRPHWVAFRQGVPFRGGMRLKTIAYLFAAFLGVFGLMFVVGSQGQALRIVIGIVLLGAGAALVYLSRIRPLHTTLEQKVDLSGDVDVQSLQCKQCGGTLDKKSVTVNAGALFVNCKYCGATYQLEEEPKW